MLKKIRPFSPVLLFCLSVFLFACLKEKTSPSIEGCTSEVSYDAIIKPIIQVNCSTSGCHNSSAAGGYDLTNHHAVSDNADIILKVIRHENGVTAMPLGGAKLSDSTALNFGCWIQQGKKDN